MRFVARMILLFVCTAGWAMAGSPANAEINERVASRAYAATTCGVYFGLVEKALNGASEAKGATPYHARARSMLDLAYTLAHDAGVKGQTIHATIQVETERLMARIDHNTANIMTLVNEYGERCEEVEDFYAPGRWIWLNQ